MSDLPDTIRSLPTSADAERAVLSCCLRDPHLVVRVQSALGGGDRAAHAFYLPQHHVIWAAMQALYQTKTTFDLITLGEMLKGADELIHAGGIGYLAQLLDDVPTAAMIDHYLEILIDRGTRRAIIQRLQSVAAEAYDPEKAVVDLIDRAERTLFALRELGTDKADRTGPRPISAVLNTDVLPAIEAAYKNRGKATRGLPTGFVELDRMTLGLEPGKLYVIAARPAQGKTSLAMNCAEHVATAAGAPSLVFSLEMSAEELAQRMLVSHANLDIYRVRDGFWSRESLSRLAHSGATLGGLPLYLDDPADLRIHELRSRARRAVAQFGIRLIIVDYLQLVKGTSKQSEASRVNEVGEVSRGLKAMAKELAVPVIALCQLNRNPDERKYGVPKLSDLRESGTIEQDADLVGLLYRPGHYARDAEERERLRDIAYLDIAKQRSGPTGGGEDFRKKHPEWDIDGCPGIPLKFVGARVRFENPDDAKLYN